MITDWQTIPMMLGTHHVADIDGKYDITIINGTWALGAVLLELDGKPVRINRDGTVDLPDGTHLHSAIAKAIVVGALHDFDRHRDALLEDMGCSEPILGDPEYTGPEYRQVTF